MNTKQTEKTKLIYGGKDIWEKTSQFKNKVKEIEKEVKDKYSETLLNERNLGRLILIKVRITIEIWKRIKELSSLKNLHTMKQGRVF